MSVEFNEEKDFNRSYTQNANRASASSGLTGWIIKKGIAKDESGANTIMIIVMIICFTLAIFFALR